MQDSPIQAIISAAKPKRGLLLSWCVLLWIFFWLSVWLPLGYLKPAMAQEAVIVKTEIANTDLAKTASQEKRNKLTFGVFAYLGIEQTRAQYAPLIAYLNQTLQAEYIELQVLPQSEMMRAIADRKLDIVTTNPTHFLVTRKMFPLTGVIATLVTADGGQPLHRLAGTIITRAERSDIELLKDIRGKSIATPSTQHMGGFRAQAYELHLAGVFLPNDAKQIIELETHQNVVMAVLDGRAEVGLIRDGILERMQRRGEILPNQLKVVNAQYHPNFPHVVSTRLYPEWPVFALPHVPEKSVRHVAAALFNLEPDHPAAQAAGIYGYTVPSDYLIVEELARTLRLPPFDQSPDFTWVDIWKKWQQGFLIAAIALVVILTLATKLVLLARKERRNHGRMELLLEALGEGVYGTNKQGQCTFINRAALDMLGLTEQEVLGRNQHSLFHYQHEDGRPYPQHDCPIHRTCQDGIVRRTEEWFTRRNGVGFQVEQVVTPVRVNDQIEGTVVAFLDISVRQAALREGARLMQRNALLLDSAGDGIFGSDMQGRCIFVNPAALTLLGYREDEVLGQNLHLLLHFKDVHGHSYPDTQCPIQQTLLDGVAREVEEHFIHKSGLAIPVHVKVTSMVELGQRVGVEVVFQDITERKAMEARLIELATTDSLTGLPNRRHFIERITQELNRIHRFGKSACLLMLDLDHFKLVNDRYGHASGDFVLKSFAKMMRAQLRQTDMAGRLGGEEFAILLPETELDSAGIFADRLRQRLASLPQNTGDIEFWVTVSIGYTSLSASDKHVDEALARADQALYRAKENGRNRIEVSHIEVSL